MDYDGKVETILEWYKKSKQSLKCDHIDLSSLENPPKWEIMIIEPFGRCLVAKENIKEGEIIFVDYPIVTGPKQDCDILCLGCYCQLDIDDYYCCSKCGWPLCGPECEKKGYHPLECSVYSASGYKPSTKDFTDENPMYEAMLPLRCLLIEDKYPEKWKTLMVMESHDKLREGTELWKVEQKNVCEFLREKLKIDKSDEQIHQVTGILDINCHEIRSNIQNSQKEMRVRGIYPLCAMMSHDCSSNTHHTLMDDMVMLVVASRNIYAGHQITGTYTHVLSGVIERRKHLKYGKFFDCICERCKDPTDFGTYFSALKCSKKDCNGNIIPSNPLQTDNNSDFVCEKCDFHVRCGIVNKLTNMIYIELQDIPENDPLELEIIFRKYQNILHPNHYHLIGIKHSLSQMYGRIKGFLLEELSSSQMQRKMECCRDLLVVIDRIDPGISRLRGLTLYELHAPMVFRANNSFKEKTITKSDFVEVLNDSLSLLQNSIKCLQFEPINSLEGQICQIAKGSVKELFCWFETVKELPESNFITEKLIEEEFEDLTLEGLLKNLEDY